MDSRAEDCKGKLFGLVGLIFFAGLVAGGFATHLAHRLWIEPKLVSAAVLDAGEKAAAIEHFNRELELSQAQAQAIEAILDEFIMQQADMVARYQTTRQSGQSRILEILNDDQRRRFQQVLNEINQRRKD